MAQLEDLTWRFVEETARPGALHMALEEIAAERAATDGLATVRVFRWQPTTLSLGYGQDAGTVDWEHCLSVGVDVTRRPTGGGGIYHDHHGDISYSIVVPAAAVGGELTEAYHTLCEPVLGFLRELGLDAGFAQRERPAIHEPVCFLRDIHPAHDVVVDGGKISGNAQYRRRDAVIQHGSILHTNRPADHLGVFADVPVDAATFAERTTAIREHASVDRADAVAAFGAALRSWSGARRGTWDAEELERARALAAEKYDARSWIRGPSGEAQP